MIWRLMTVTILALAATWYIQMGWLSSDAVWWQNTTAAVFLVGLGRALIGGR